MMADAEFKSLVYEIGSLERPEWMINSGLSKGVYHDRNPLMTIVLAGTKVRFRQIQPASNSGVTLSFLNDDSKTEAHHEVTTEWAEIVVRHVSVPFLSTPFTDHGGDIVKVEVEAYGGLKFLPFYNSEHGADLFFRIWDSEEAEYAVVESTSARILIPARDKGALKALHQATGLKSLTDYYDGIIDYFNYLAGLSFNPLASTDKNIPNRFFMKADKSGPGAAYYGHTWTAESSDSVARFWLDINGANWGSIHEIGHGYQGTFMANSSVHLGEVWNNVLAAHYQKKVLGEDYYKVGWLYVGGEENLYAYVKELFDSGTVGGNLSVILFFLLLIFERTGEQGIIEFFQRYRRLSNAAGFKAENYPAMDLLSAVAIDVANVDVSGFMSFAKVSLTPWQWFINMFSNANAVYPLYMLVSESSLKQVQGQLGLRCPFDLVSCAQLDVTGLKGSLSLNLEESLFGRLWGKVLLLRDGRGPDRAVEIRTKTVVINGLPVGPYALLLPSVDNGEYQGGSDYVPVKETINSVDCVYKKKYASALADQVINLGGLLGVFCKIHVSVSTGHLLVQVTGTSPHSYFEKVYAEITVRDLQENIVFYRSMLGDKTELFAEEIPISKGFCIEIFHLESSRIRVFSTPESAVIDIAKQVNKLKVTDQGLVNVELGTDAGKNLKGEIDKWAAIFDKNKNLVLYDECPIRQDMRRAINTFEESERNELFERYRTVEFARPPINRVFLGRNFLWRLQGNAGRNVGHVEVSIFSREVKVIFHNVVPHEYFASTYISVVVSSLEGKIKYSRELRGDRLAEASRDIIPFEYGGTISVMHREPSRSFLSNVETMKVATTGQVQHASYKSLLGLSLASYWPASKDKPSALE